MELTQTGPSARRELAQGRRGQRARWWTGLTLLACATIWSCAAWQKNDQPTGSVAPRYTAVEPDPAAEAPLASTQKPDEPAPAPAPPPAADSAAAVSAAADAPLVALLEGYYADFGARNWTAFAGHFWPGATIATIRKPLGAPRETVVVTSIDEYVLNAGGAGVDQTPITIKLTARDVRVDGFLAQVLARFDANVQTPAQGELHNWHGLDAFTLMKHDGEWRIAALVIGSSSYDD
jgi:hypothetical protein